MRDIGTAINESVENSTKVAEAIERLREAGYEMELTLRLEIGLRPHTDETEESDAGLNLTEEDRSNFAAYEDSESNFGRKYLSLKSQISSLRSPSLSSKSHSCYKFQTQVPSQLRS